MCVCVCVCVTDVTAKRRRHISNYSNYAYVAFQTPLEQEAWLKMITEMKRGLELSKGKGGGGGIGRGRRYREGEEV